MRPDLTTAAILLRLKKKNAETIFGAIAEEIAGIHVDLLDARAFLDDHLAFDGLMTKGHVKVDADAIDHGVEIAREVARLDIGQGVVVRKGTVVAVEAFEGTDEMLRRAGGFKTDGLIFVMDDHGELSMAEATPAGYRSLGHHEVFSDGHDAWGPMALVAGRLIVRDMTRMACLDIATK